MKKIFCLVCLLYFLLYLVPGASRDPWKVLELKRGASEDKIKSAFRKKSLKYHPDKQAGKSDAEKAEAEAKFIELSDAYTALQDINSEYHREENSRQFSRDNRNQHFQDNQDRMFMYRGPDGSVRFERFGSFHHSNQQFKYQHQYQSHFTGTSLSELLLSMLWSLLSYVFQSPPGKWIISMLVICYILSYIFRNEKGDKSSSSIISWILPAIALAVIASIFTGIALEDMIHSPIFITFMLFAFICGIFSSGILYVESDEEYQMKAKDAARKAREAAEKRSRYGDALLPLTSSSALTDSPRINIVVMNPSYIQDATLLKRRFRSDPVNFYYIDLTSAIDSCDYPSAYALMKRGRKWTEYAAELDGELEKWVLKVIGAGETISWDDEDPCPLMDVLSQLNDS
jgi:hypothetical protein